MNSVFFSSVPETLILEARAGADLWELMHDADVYRTSFEHYAFEHLNFLQKQKLMLIPYGREQFPNSVSAISPKEVSYIAKKINYTDLKELAEKANKVLGEDYDAATLMMIIEHRIVPLFNEAAEKQHYIVVDYG